MTGDDDVHYVNVDEEEYNPCHPQEKEGVSSFKFKVERRTKPEGLKSNHHLKYRFYGLTN